MPHLDEGTLQAYLDGARSGQTSDEREAIARHLADCAACTDALEALKAEDERAAALLGTSAAAGPPPFDEIRRRAEAAGPTAAGPTATPPRRGWTRYRWAASIAVALGAGWLANDLLRTTPQAVVPAAGPPETAAEALPVRAPAAPTGPEAEVPVAAPPAADLADARRQGAADRASEGMARERVAAPEPRVRAVAPSVEPLPDADAPAPTPPLTADLAAEGVAPVAPSVLRGRVTDEAGRPLEAAQVFLDGSNTGTLTRADGTYALRLPARAEDLFRDMTLRVRLIGYGEETRAIPATASDTVAADVQLSSTAVALSQLVVTGTATPDEPSPEPAAAAVSAPAFLAAPRLPAPWTPVEPDRFEATLGFAPHIVPELEIVSREVRLQDGVTEARIVQRLDGGGQLTLLQAPGRPPSMAPEAGAETATLQVGDVWVVASAALAAPELQALLDRLR